MKGNWSCTSHKSKNLVDLYQASLKAKTKDVEVNFFFHNSDFNDGPIDWTC